MPRKLLKRIMPDHQKMCEHRYFRRFGQRLTKPRLWHLNRRSIAMGLALGLFIAFMPFPGHMMMAAALAILLEVNLPMATLGVWLTNPLTMAPLFYYAYKLGAWLLSIPVATSSLSFSWDGVSHEFLALWQPLLLGCFICGIVAALVGIISVRLGWRLYVMYRWMSRRHKRMKLTKV